VQLAWVLISEHDWKGARAAYTRGVELDPSVAAPALAVQLGVDDARNAPAPVRRDPDLQPRKDDPAPKAAVVGPEIGHRDRKQPASRFVLERPTIAFADVGGLADLKAEISIKILQPARTPELFAAYGKKSGGGLLMYGPPGCGKTLLARATAGELQGRFLSVGIHDVLDMWLGSSERNLHALFEEARRNAPCVLFFDEVDALASKRSDHVSTTGRTVVNQFLAELDGSTASNEGVLVLGATNAPWHLDSAFRRPGRFDRVLFVPPPDEEARAAALAVHLAGKPQQKLDLAQVAKRTHGFSGADLKALVDLAIEDKLRDALKTGRPAPITTKDLCAGVKRIAPSTREWFASARNYALFANQGGAYDELVRYMNL
jgi:SpoVK/Ycf46/Vps4 family AAA+-type ATPase